MTEDKTVKNLDIVHEGTQIILPVIKGERMSYDEGIKWLERKKAEDEQKTGVYYEINCSPLDGLVAFSRAIAEKYGWSQGIPTPGFFGNTPPMMIGVQVSATEKMNVPWGRISIPGIDGHVNTGMKGEPSPQFLVTGEVKKKHAENVRELIVITERILKENSIYKGKAVKVSFTWMEDDEFDPMAHAPKFMDLQGVRETDLIFGDDVIASLNIGLFTPIEYSAACRQNAVPLKRGVLLHGPYGTGKTMTATVTALKTSRNGWTFIYLDDVRDLKHALAFAAQYAPAVVFAEDVDRAVTGERSTDMDAILNILDGVDTKGAEIITVLTTNHLEDINQAMLRPGRLDVLVEVSPPDASAAARLVKLYSRGLLEDGVDLEQVGKSLEGNIPAFIREVTERAKIAAISRTHGGDIEGKVLEVDLLNAAVAMKNHASLLKPKEKEEKRLPDVFIVHEVDDNVIDARETLKRAAG